VDNWTE